ncbi:hypothetical protein ACTQ49_14460 [Luteococcus sp. Sow4_B9]|uniref:hypothetical protein n=1 Tax=Luteococcus sp. Sow4_B9 TaxID=3438792 RepID=UPI003F9D3DF0
MTIAFNAHTLTADSVVLHSPVPVTADPRLASADFTLDELLAFATDADELPTGSSWQVAGQRSMARHGSSALDTEVMVRLLLPKGSDEDPEALLSQAMMRIALALASPETGVVDDRFQGPLAGAEA